MDGNDILKLVNAGFTKDEITKMFANKTAEEPVKTETKQEEQKQGEQKQENNLTTLEQKFDKFIETMMKNNFLGANQPPEETVDDIIANIINPKN